MKAIIVVGIIASMVAVGPAQAQTSQNVTEQANERAAEAACGREWATSRGSNAAYMTCLNTALAHYFEAGAFPHMELVYGWLARRLELAEQADQGLISRELSALRVKEADSQFEDLAKQRSLADSLTRQGLDEIAHAKQEREQAEHELNELARREAQQNQADQDAARRAMQLCIAGRLGAPGDFSSALAGAAAACAGGPTYQPPSVSVYVEPSLPQPPTTTTCAPSGGRSFSCTTQ